MTYHVTVQPAGRTFTVNPTDTVLEAALAEHVGLPYSCKAGSCGTCKCKLVSGKVKMGPHQAKALSPEEEAAGQILTCCAKPESDLVIEARVVSGLDLFPARKMPVRVLELERVCPDVMILRLQLPARDQLLYLPGQYIEFILRDGSRRSYSIANAPHTQVAGGVGLELHIRLAPGGQFTPHVFEGMKVRDLLRIEGPFGSFFLREDSDKPMIFLATGTGFAPIKAMIEHMRHMGSKRPAVFYWGGRRPADIYMADWVREQAAAMPNLTFVPIVSRPLPEDNWQGRTGHVSAAAAADFADLSGHQIYACGSPAMVDEAQRELVGSHSLPEDEFYSDAFTDASSQAVA